MRETKEQPGTSSSSSSSAVAVGKDYPSGDGCSYYCGNETSGRSSFKRSGGLIKGTTGCCFVPNDDDDQEQRG